ncbi:putative ABC-type xenobiotic transporter [Helianthus annuus]|nr:putative ABC-type xenobiotic transporter [Helianthus annuus]
MDIKGLKLKWLRQQIGLVSQEPALFATTIQENILLGRPNASMVEIEEAARVSNAHSFIIKLPDAYDTQVSPFLNRFEPKGILFNLHGTTCLLLVHLIVLVRGQLGLSMLGVGERGLQLSGGQK